LNITIQFLGIIGAAIVGPLVLAAVLAGIMVWLSKQVTAAPEPAPAARVRKAVVSRPQPRPQPEPGPQPEVESFASEATSFEHEETHKRLVPAWLVLVYAVVIVWALVYILMQVVPFFKPLMPASSPALAVAAPTPAALRPAASTGTGNAANGEKLFTAQGCSACHSLKEGEKIIGPSLYHSGQTSLSRLKDATYTGKAQSAEDYIRESILQPNVYVAPGFPAGVMVQDFVQKLAPQDIDDLVAFLMTQ